MKQETEHGNISWGMLSQVDFSQMQLVVTINFSN